MPVLAPCFLNMQTSPPQQSSLAHIDNSNILQCTSHCYAERRAQKEQREGYSILTPGYVRDDYLYSLTQTIAWGGACLLNT